MAQDLGKSILTLGVDGSQMTAGMRKAQGDMARTGKAAKDLDANLRFMRGGIGQLGHQIQDSAVQLQMGTDAMIILGQQGSQVASLFGPGGALLGAFLAIGAAVAGPVISAFTGSSAALEDLRDSALEATPTLDRLTGALRAQQKIATRRELKSLLIDQEKALNKLNETTDIMDRLDLKAIIQAGATEIERLKNIYRGLNPELQATIDTLQMQVQTFGASSTEIALYNANLDGQITSQESTIIALTRKIEKLNAEAAANEESRRLAKAKADEEQRAAKASEQADKKALANLETFILTKEEKEVAAYAKNLASVQGFLERERITQEQAQALITGIIEKEQDRRADASKKSAEKQLKADQKARADAVKGMGDQLMALDSSNKKVFRMQKAYRMAEATMGAFQAATNALAAPFPFPIPQAMATAALTFGLANVAQIKAQSFEGGGFTGYGARAGGLDGKGGRMAMIHPNETIVDHRKGGAAGVTIVNNVDARGAGADVDQKIKAAMTQTSQQTIMTIQDLMRRGRFA